MKIRGQKEDENEVSKAMQENETSRTGIKAKMFLYHRNFKIKCIRLADMEIYKQQNITP